MIREYFRPASVEDALALLIEADQNRKPLGGGTRLSRQQVGEFDVVDLQGCGLDKIKRQGTHVHVGAMVRLVNLINHPDVHPEIKKAINIDANENNRNIATLGGWLVSSSGRSIFSTLLLALDSTLTWEPKTNRVQMGDWLPVREKKSPGLLMTEVDWNLELELTFESVARTPQDQPLVIVAVAQWRSGRTRVALGGYGSDAIIAMDGPDDYGAHLACKDAYYDAGDQWATAEYRRDVAAQLASRCIEKLRAIKESEA